MLVDCARCERWSTNSSCGLIDPVTKHWIGLPQPSRGSGDQRIRMWCFLSEHSSFCLAGAKGKSLSYCCLSSLTHISPSQAGGAWACAFLTPEEDPSARLIPLITSQPYCKWATPDNHPKLVRKAGWKWRQRETGMDRGWKEGRELFQWSWLAGPEASVWVEKLLWCHPPMHTGSIPTPTADSFLVFFPIRHGWKKHNCAFQKQMSQTLSR